MSRKKRQAGLERIAERRRVVEDRLAAVRASMADELGRAPSGRGMLVALVAGTVGLALALRGRTLQERREVRGPDFDDLP